MKQKNKNQKMKEEMLEDASKGANAKALLLLLLWLRHVFEACMNALPNSSAWKYYSN